MTLLLLIIAVCILLAALAPLIPEERPDWWELYYGD